MISIWENAEKLGGLGEVVTAVVACVAIVFAYLQIEAVKHSQREATAKDIYRDYLKLAIEYPSYADGSNTDEAGYKWFVALLLGACDELISAMPKAKDWTKIRQLYT